LDSKINEKIRVGCISLEYFEYSKQYNE
jgi:hypothetical protein